MDHILSVPGGLYLLLQVGNPQKKWSSHHGQQESPKCSTWCNLKNDKMFFHYQGKPFNITVIQVYAPTSNAEEAEVELFYEDLQHLLTNAKKRYPFHHGGLKCKIRKSTGKVGLGVQNKAAQRLAEFCQANTLVIANTLFQHCKR